MTQVLEKDNVFLASFDRLERTSSADSPRWVQRIRRAAMARFVETGYPTTRQEEWRFTDAAPLAEIPFEPARPPSDPPTPREIDEAASFTPGSRRIAFLNGYYRHDLSSLKPAGDGVILESLAEALSERRELIEPHLGRHAAYQSHPFVALNTAFLDDGTFLYIPRGTAIKDPIHLLYVWTETDRAAVAHPRNLIVAEREAQATIVETYLGPAESVYFTNTVTEIALGPGARLDHYKLQREGREAFHMGTVEVRQERDSTFSSHLISLGGLLARNETNVRLDAEGCHSTLNGLYIARGRQHLDSRTRVDHAKPHCHSQELYKGILDDRAEGVFNGKIVVHPDAQKTDAKQTNQAILLSADATLNTKPQLEIFADDVKCTHGATVGQLDEEALFYLRSRGISHRRARDLLIRAFADDVIHRVPAESVRAELERILWADRYLSIDAVAEEIA